MTSCSSSVKPGGKPPSEPTHPTDRVFPIRPVQCMSGCRRHCTVALQAPGKITYFSGDLPADETSAEQVLACAALH